MAHPSELVVAHDVGLGLNDQGQGLGHGRWMGRLGAPSIRRCKTLMMWVLQGAPSSRPTRQRQDGLLIVLQHQGKHLHHLTVAARLLQEQSLQSFECVWQLGKRGAVAQCARLALQYGR